MFMIAKLTNLQERCPSSALRRKLGFFAAVAMATIVVAPTGSFAATTKTKAAKVAPKTAAKPVTKVAPKAAIFKSDLPSVTVLDLSSSKNVDLASFADGKRPSLIWFWAPH